MTDGRYKRKDYIVDGVDYIGKDGDTENIDSIFNFAPEFLTDSQDAIKLRKILRQKSEKIDYEEWHKWSIKNNKYSATNRVLPRNWLDVLRFISSYLVRYDEYTLENKTWLITDSKTKKQAIDAVIKKTKALRYALRNENLPNIPSLYEFMSCGQIMFVSKHYLKLQSFCRENGAKALHDETLQEVLENFEEYLEQKKSEHQGTSSKGVRYDRDLAKSLLKILYTDLFRMREKAKPITLIMLIINIRYKKNYSYEKVKEWISN